jgi:uncharacterized membrane protein
MTVGPLTPISLQRTWPRLPSCGSTTTAMPRGLSAKMRHVQLSAPASHSLFPGWVLLEHFLERVEGLFLICFLGVRDAVDRSVQIPKASRVAGQPLSPSPRSNRLLTQPISGMGLVP